MDLGPRPSTEAMSKHENRVALPSTAVPNTAPTGESSPTSSLTSFTSRSAVDDDQEDASTFMEMPTTVGPQVAGTGAFDESVGPVDHLLTDEGDQGKLFTSIDIPSKGQADITPLTQDNAVGISDKESNRLLHSGTDQRTSRDGNHLMAESVLSSPPDNTQHIEGEMIERCGLEQGEPLGERSHTPILRKVKSRATATPARSSVPDPEERGLDNKSALLTASVHSVSDDKSRAYGQYVTSETVQLPMVDTTPCRQTTSIPSPPSASGSSAKSVNTPPTSRLASSQKPANTSPSSLPTSSPKPADTLTESPLALFASPSSKDVALQMPACLLTTTPPKRKGAKSLQPLQQKRPQTRGSSKTSSTSHVFSHSETTLGDKIRASYGMFGLDGSRLQCSSAPPDCRGLRSIINMSAVARNKAVLTTSVFKQLCDTRDEVLSSFPRSVDRNSNDIHLVRRIYNAEWAPKDPLTLPNIALELATQLVINKTDRTLIRFMMCSILAVIKYLNEDVVGYVRILRCQKILLKMGSIRKSPKR